PSCLASSRASPTSGTRWCSAGTTRSCPSRSSSRWWAPRTTRGGPRCSPSSCSPSPWAPSPPSSAGSAAAPTPRSPGRGTPASPPSARPIASLRARQSFAGRRAFEFAALLSFAIPGTVVGVSYILAFNVPPLELTGTGLILVICFVFRNLPVGVRAGIAALAQIDRSLDEASLTLGARSFATVRRVVLPLLRPALVAALVYSFVRAMTAVSAVIFLVSARYNLATAYIVGRGEAGAFRLALAYARAPSRGGVG